MSAETVTLYRDEVEMTRHYVYVYRGNGDGRVDYDGIRDDSHPLAGMCICHHAIWHSCPSPSKGEKMFDALPTRVVGEDRGGRLAALEQEVASLRRRLSDFERGRR